MATTTETVLIEFVSDASGLQSGEDRLKALGQTDANTARIFKLTNAELQKRQALINQVAAGNDKVAISVSKEQAQYNKVISTLKNLNGETKKVAQTLSTFTPKQLADEFKQLGVSADEYVEALKGAETQQVSLRQELKAMTQALAEMKLAGDDNSEAYVNMAKRAGEIKDAIADANAEIKDFASDTKGFDNLLGTAQAVAGGFAVAQGAAALFGDESQELQETLLRVNAVMSVLQGLQSIQNALQKEGSLIKVKDTAATYAQVAAQKVYSLVVGESTGALKAFKIALAATGIGLLVIAIGALVANWDKIKESISGVSEEQKSLIEITQEAVAVEEEKLQALNDQDDILRLQGKSEQEILQLKISQIEAIIAAREQQLMAQEELQKSQIEAEARNKEILKGILDFISIPLNAVIKTVNYVSKALGKDLDLPSFGEFIAGKIFDPEALQKEADKESKEIKKQITDLQNQRAGYLLSIQGLNKEAADKARDEAKKQQDRLLQDQLASLERQRLAAEKAGTDTLDIERKIIAKKAEIDLRAEQLTANQRKLILEKSLSDQDKLTAEHKQKQAAKALEDEISRNNALLSQVGLSNEERLQLTTDNIAARAAIEIQGAQGNADKIKEIEAKRDADILAARSQAIQNASDNEIELLNTRSAAYRRSLETIAADENKSVSERSNAIDKLTNYEKAAIDKRIKAVEDQYAIGAISAEEYTRTVEKLEDDKVKAVEDAEKKITKITKDGIEDRKKANIKLAQDIVEVASGVVDVLSSLYSLQADQQNEAISEQRARVDELLETGAITEKEAEQRRKKIDQQEKRYKQQQAEREKRIAVFEALLAIPRAFLQGLSTGNPVLGAIFAAIAAAQAAMVIARPIPKFAKGKKDSYEGPGEVGEAGTELVQKDGKMYVVDKPQIIWLGKKDKVFNPAETAAMMAVPQMASNKHLMVPEKAAPNFAIDYQKLGKSVAQNIPQTGINIDENGFKEWVKDGESFTKYLNNRRSY